MERNTIFFILGLSAAALGAGYLFFSRKDVDEENKTLLDEWSNEMLALELGRKLGLSKNEVLSAFDNKASSILSQRIEEFVSNISLKFTKTSASEVEAQIYLVYSDETDYTAKRKFSWLEMPETIREEFLRSRNRSVIREWRFPWAIA